MFLKNLIVHKNNSNKIYFSLNMFIKLFPRDNLLNPLNTTKLFKYYQKFWYNVNKLNMTSNKELET